MQDLHIISPWLGELMEKNTAVISIEELNLSPIKVTSKILYPQTVIIEKEKYKVLDTYINLKWLLSHFNASVRNNLMKRRWEVCIPGYSLFEEDKENSAIEKVQYLATLNMMPNNIKNIGRHIKTIAEEDSYHPIVEHISKNKWDKVNRLDEFISTIVSKDPVISKILIKTWMVSAIAAIYNPHGFVCHGVLVLQGKQGIGKTGWIKSLDPINCGAVREGANLDPSNKDDVISSGEHWIVELGELDSTFKKDIARLKSFITSSSDHIRNPYAVKASHYYRRTIFAASVNSDAYLIDETGNRRWWTIPVESINFNHNLDMTQVWSEVYDLWVNGHKAELSKEDQSILDGNNIKFEKIDPIKELLLTNYDWGSIDTERYLSTTQVMHELGYLKPSKSELVFCGKMLKELSNGNQKIRKGINIYPIPRTLMQSEKGVV